MKSGDTYRFSLSWPMDSEERILAGEFLSKLGNKKSRFIIQLVCEYLGQHPEALDAKETIKVIVNSTSGNGLLIDTIRSLIQAELAGKGLVQQAPDSPDTAVEELPPAEDIGDMFGNLAAWK
jgi:hypothetical protein